MNGQDESPKATSSAVFPAPRREPAVPAAMLCCLLPLLEGHVRRSLRMHRPQQAAKSAWAAKRARPSQEWELQAAALRSRPKGP